jgi:hypothetical protein
MTFFRDRNRLFMRNEFTDGTFRTIEIAEKRLASGQQVFTKKPDDGDYYLINGRGDLEWWDEEGHFLTSPRAE